MTAEQQHLAAMIDHTLLKAEATSAGIETLCREAREYGFASVCVNPSHIAHASELLRGSAVKVCTVIGFPLGANTTATKVFEAENALANGATEIDMVLNIGALVDGNDALVESDIRAVTAAGHKAGAIVKVIIETALLGEAHKIKACEIVTRAAADFIKTSTGFSTKGATLDDIRLMKTHVGANVSIKASGGIRDLAFTQELIAAGASRIGASAGVAIVDALGGKASINEPSQGY
ncbi:MAG: deoxyribose-phosphate aldolase [Candidatus Kapaibacterium sp.]|nr:MAG: deoxyribose-phosphate aldolase [Candidatus Kapabacteria bacterium]